MGSLLSRFRKKPTTEEQLKKIEDGLRKIEDYKRSTERKHKKLIANIIIYSAALYILACVIVFVWYLPESWMIRLGLLVPLVMVPVIVYSLKRLISKYFDSRMIKANEEYSDLQRKKKDIIDNVMEKETFNKAKEILAKYAPEKLDKKEQPQLSRPVADMNVSLRKRTIGQVMRSTGVNHPTQPRPEPINALAIVPRRDLSPISSLRPGVVPRQPLPQPMFPRERGFGDKLVEFMIGDGPGYRYALICLQCRGHNGMALKEEFPYMAFNCCYCNQFNPARSKRPVAPKMPEIKELPGASVIVSQSLPNLPIRRQLEQPPSHTKIKEITTDDDNIANSTEKTAEDAAPEEAPSSEDSNSAESSEKTAEDTALLEKAISDLKLVDPVSEDIEEKSDEEFQNLGFSEADLEFLRKVNPRLCKPDEPEERQEGNVDQET